jgi:ribosome-binding protein aMBF1 (putative translation factor)
MPIGKVCQLILLVTLAIWHTYRMDAMTRFVELVALVLREHADRVGLSGAELARRSGVSQGQISRIFTGKRTVSVDHVVALANALGVRGSAVFAEAERRLGEEAAGEASPPRSE